MKGTYSLIIYLPKDSEIKVGKLGKIKFMKGNYAYIGSALKNLEKRVERHLREEKKLHWHIDYLLEEAQIEKVLYGKGKERKECSIAHYLTGKFPSIKNFGSSDCKCGSHLFFSEDSTELNKSVVKSFKGVGLKPKEW